MRKIVIIPLMFLAGCATTFYTVQMPMPGQIENPDIVAAAVSTFQDNGFVVTLANEKVCTVTTDAKSLTSTGSKVFQKILAGSADSRTIRLSLSGNSQNKTIKLNPIVQQSTESLYGAGTPSAATPNQSELNLVKKIAEELATKLNIPSEQIEITSYQQ